MSSVVFRMCWGWRIGRSRWKKLRDTTDWTVGGLSPGQISRSLSSIFCIYLSDCVCFLLLYRFSSVSRSNSIQLTGWIPFFITLGPPSAPSQSLSSPLNQGQCLSVSEADSIDFRNHSISFSSSHRLATKEKKKNPHFTHTTKEKNRLHLHSTKKKKLFISHQTPLAVPNNPESHLLRPPPSLLWFFFLSLVYIVVALSLFSLVSAAHVWWAEDIQLLPEMNAGQKNAGSLQKVVVSRAKWRKMGKMR